MNFKNRLRHLGTKRHIITGALLSMIVLSAPMGSSFRSIAVRIMVMMTATLCLPRSVMLPKVIFLNKTAFLIPCSEKLFVGFAAGYFRNTKSSSWNFIKRMRILSVSWYFSSGCLSNFLNRLVMSFFSYKVRYL